MALGEVLVGWAKRGRPRFSCRYRPVDMELGRRIKGNNVEIGARQVPVSRLHDYFQGDVHPRT